MKKVNLHYSFEQRPGVTNNVGNSIPVFDETNYNVINDFLKEALKYIQEENFTLSISVSKMDSTPERTGT